MVSKVILEYGKIGFVCNKPQKNSGLIKKKGFTCRKTGFVWKKEERKSPFSEKKGFRLQKNRIYLRKKGDHKNRKKKYFFPP